MIAASFTLSKWIWETPVRSTAYYTVHTWGELTLVSHGTWVLILQIAFKAGWHPRVTEKADHCLVVANRLVGWSVRAFCVSCRNLLFHMRNVSTSGVVWSRDSEDIRAVVAMLSLFSAITGWAIHIPQAALIFQPRIQKMEFPFPKACLSNLLKRFWLVLLGHCHLQGQEDEVLWLARLSYSPQ